MTVSVGKSANPDISVHCQLTAQAEEMVAEANKEKKLRARSDQVGAPLTDYCLVCLSKSNSETLKRKT